MSNEGLTDHTLLHLRESLGLNRPLPKPTSDHSESILVTRLPCIGRLHFVRDKEGVMALSGIVAYWIYGVWSSYYIILKPHYDDGYIPDGILVYHFGVAALCLIALFRSSTLNPGRVPLVDESYAKSQGWEPCPHCGRFRPDKAHHCRRCGQCVLRMDHHCPWVNNCVGESNHHVFHQLLFYACLFGFNTFVLSMFHFWIWPACKTCDHEAFLVKHAIWFHYLSFIMACAMAFFMFTQFLGHHFNLLLNRTTIDTMRDADINSASYQLRTFYHAYSELCGTRYMCLWPLPWRQRKSSLLYHNPA